MLKINKILFSGTLTLLITFGLFNAINYFYHFAMARMLTLEDYGSLAVLFSLIYIISIFGESIQLVVTKYSSSEKNPGKIKNLLKRSLRKSILLAFFIFIIYLIIGFPLSHLLKIDYLLISLNGLFIFALFIIPITRGIMQGRKMFRQLGMNMIIESAIRIVLGVILVFIGWKVYGAIIGVLVGLFLALIYSFFSLRTFMKAKESIAKTDNIYTYSRPAFLITLVILVFYSLDVIIAKIVFDPNTAGIYALTSVLAKTIFFATQPIARVMFSLTSEEKSNKLSEKIFMNSLGILIALVLPALIIFFLFPDFLMHIFSGKTLYESSSILFFIALAVSLLSFTNLILQYKLSLGKTKGYFIFLLFIVIEAALLLFYSHNLLQFSLAFLTANAIFLWGSVILLKE